jgi:hypothetical protein
MSSSRRGLRNATADAARHAAKPIQFKPGIHDPPPSRVPAAALDPDAELIAAWVIHQLQQRRQIDRELLQIGGRPAFQLLSGLVRNSTSMRLNEVHPAFEAVHALTAPVQVARAAE